MPVVVDFAGFTDIPDHAREPVVNQFGLDHQL